MDPAGSVTPSAAKLPLLPIDPREPCRPDELMVAHYNVENLFDPVDDPNVNDEQFTAKGPTGYDEAQLSLHLRNLSRVIRGLNGGKGPDVLALTEIENAAVVERLRREGLSELGYHPVQHAEDGDARGIEPAVLTRFPPIGAPKLHPVVNEAGKRFRSILETTVDVNGRPLTLLVNHWIATRTAKNDGLTPAQRDKELRKEAKMAAERMFTAETLRAVVERILAEDPGREIVMLGDFNEGLDGPALKDGLGKANTVDEALEGRRVFNTVDALAEQKTAAGALGDPVQLGTHYYVPGKTWNTFDHLLVSHTLLDSEGLAWVPGSTAVFAPDWLRDPSHGGPRRFFLPKIGDAPPRVDEQGASDHFPVAMRLRKVGEARRPVG